MSFPSLALLRCVACTSDVRADGDRVVCVQCNTAYSTNGQTIFFVPSEQGHPIDASPDSFMVFLKNIFKRVPWLYRLFIAIFGASSGGITPNTFVRRHIRPDGIILNLGSGAGERYGSAIHVDLFAFPGVDVVADIAVLPFRNNSVDAVMCIQVLEHVPDPERIIAEIYRVLRPGGAMYLATPFMIPYHSSPKDYYRWTLDGLRVLSDGFEEVHSGLRHGPTSGIAIMLAYWFATFLSFGSKSLFEFFMVLWTIIVAPIAHLFDLFFNRLEFSVASASGFYYIGKKPSERLS
ncbi:MAG TPA: class I SAM-dependent methyltransferase [Candidatus Methylomirabilis sp.]|nr:class I SAM-dependent methyltransferase [Candidatus Methylomirabilis sp.]